MAQQGEAVVPLLMMLLTAQEQINTETIASHSNPATAASTHCPDVVAMWKIPTTDSANAEKLIIAINMFLASVNGDLISVLSRLRRLMEQKQIVLKVVMG